MIKKDLTNEIGYSNDSDTIRLGLKDIKMNAIRPLEELSIELSKKYGKKVEVVDVLEQQNFGNQHSLITGQEYDEFFHGYTYNRREYTHMIVNTQKQPNVEGTKNNIYQTILVFKEI